MSSLGLCLTHSHSREHSYLLLSLTQATVLLLNHIARNHMLQGNFVGAQSMSDEAVAVCEKEVGSSGVAPVSLELVGTSYHMRGIAALQQGEWDEAEEHLQVCVRVCA